MKDDEILEHIQNVQMALAQAGRDVVIIDKKFDDLREWVKAELKAQIRNVYTNMELLENKATEGHPREPEVPPKFPAGRRWDC